MAKHLINSSVITENRGYELTQKLRDQITEKELRKMSILESEMCLLCESEQFKVTGLHFMFLLDPVLLSARLFSRSYSIIKPRKHIFEF